MPDFHNFGVIVQRIASFLSTSTTAYYVEGSWPSVKNMIFSYDGAAVFNDYSMHLSPGEKVVLVGPNGCGKTTLAHILSGYLAPSGGDVVLPAKISSVTLPISFPPLRVKDLIIDTYMLSVFGLGSEAVLGAFADQVSVGQQQKLAILLTLSREADLYIIDEPLANLDQESRDVAIDLILERTKGKV